MTLYGARAVDKVPRASPPPACRPFPHAVAGSRPHPPHTQPRARAKRATTVPQGCLHGETLYCSSIGPVLVLYWSCIGPVLVLYWSYIGPILVLYWSSTGGGFCLCYLPASLRSAAASLGSPFRPKLVLPGAHRDYDAALSPAHKLDTGDALDRFAAFGDRRPVFRRQEHACLRAHRHPHM